MNSILPLFIALPLGAAFVTLILAKLWRGIGSPIGFLTSLCLVIFALTLVGQEVDLYRMGNWPPPWGIVLVSDALSTLLLLTIAVISFLVIVFSIRYMERYTAKPKFFALFMLLIAGMNGVVLTGDFFNLFVFLEIASIASYALVAFGCEHEELEASFKYLILSGVASTFILLGIGIVYSLTGTLNMADVARTIRGMDANNAVLFATALFIMGFGLKAAMVPFHPWLPDAHPSAPAPISAMLSGVLIKALGIYALVRIVFNVLGLSPLIASVFMVLGGLSMVVGVLLAVGQWDFKRLLAYHSISQMGYVVMALGVGAAVLAGNGSSKVAGLAIFGGLFHLFNHAAFKSLLFLCSGATEYATGTRQLKKLGGLAHRMPVTSVCCRVASLSIAGVPPFNGFWSKLIIIIATVQAGYYLLGALAALVAFITLVSFIKVQHYVIGGELPKSHENVREVPVSMGAAMVVLALMCLAMGLLYPLLSSTILGPARDVILEGTSYVNKVFGI